MTCAVLNKRCARPGGANAPLCGEVRRRGAPAHWNKRNRYYEIHLSWLKEHLDTNASLADIEFALSDLGLEVEGIENPADALKTFTLAKVKHAEQHPDADRLRVCTVETDEGDKQTFVARRMPARVSQWSCVNPVIMCPALMSR